ncbi:MAG: amino acid permease [Proteobacteria bacterium]|nr:amino acid permease [Pseudomonadota bacterium]
MKLFGCICLIAGTAIGVGMLALPITLAEFGLVYGSLLMLATWAISYFSAILNLELNLRAGQGLPLGGLGKYFSGPKAYALGSVSMLLLCYALVCAYIYGGTSTLISLEGFPLNFTQTACLYASCIGLVSLWPLAKIDKVTRVLFTGLLAIVITILVVVLWNLDFGKLPIMPSASLNFVNSNNTIPIVLTAFGFQVIFHTLVNYTEKDKVMLKKAFFWGSLIPAIVYVVWTGAIFSLIYGHNPEFFAKMTMQDIEVGEMVQELSRISQSQIISYLTWGISFVAISKSMICVSLGLIDALKTKHKILSNHPVAVIAVLVPTLAMALSVPNAFIKALGFAGMVIAFMAILLPLYLLRCSNKTWNQAYFYDLLKNKIVIVVIAFYGSWVVISELYRIFLSINN